MPRTAPLSVLLAWPMPNYVNPETRGPAKTVLTVVLWALVTGVVALRLYTRRFISYGFGWDDILITLAYVPATAFSIVGIVAEYEYGWNRHVWDVPPDQISAGLQLGLASFTLFDLATSLTKLSMLALLYRMSLTSKPLKLVVVSLIIINIMTMVAFVVVLFVQCNPISDYWTIHLTDTGNCINESTHLLVAGVINTTMDFVIVILPMVFILTINKLPRRQVIVVILLFSAGLAASVAGVVRTYLTFVMTTAADFDLTWHAWATWLASSVELYVGIICVSIPATKPFFARYLPRLLEVTRSRGFTDLESNTYNNTCTSTNNHSAANNYDKQDNKPTPLRIERSIHQHSHSRKISELSAATLVETRVYSPYSPYRKEAFSATATATSPGNAIASAVTSPSRNQGQGAAQKPPRSPDLNKPLPPLMLGFKGRGNTDELFLGRNGP